MPLRIGQTLRQQYFSPAGFAVQCCLRVCRCLRGERHLWAVPSNSPRPDLSKKRRKPSDLDWPQPAESLLLHPAHPGPSINARKTSDLDWQQASESLLLHPAHPGPSINAQKPSDLDWQQATESLLLHPAHPGHSRNARKPSDLDGRRRKDTRLMRACERKRVCRST